ncbi:hypothetical protein [Bradyrhizobium sp. SZCCHNRI1003]|uniref:hypothetical protein n=1 Tax=Bradyrhizobium sp. SZCCHNRI1003 TaxID=3057275 RepID=UPI002916F238|nr:hypothetical protein [Bradyrhizobium sp. SZCCHNRI1003]
MTEIALKLIDWVGANPNATILLLLAATGLLLAAAPIVALTVVGYALRTLTRRQGKADRQ